MSLAHTQDKDEEVWLTYEFPYYQLIVEGIDRYETINLTLKELHELRRKINEIIIENLGNDDLPF